MGYENPSRALLEEGFAADNNRIKKKVSLRVIPMLFVLSFVSYLDRTNLAFVRSELEDSLSINDTDFGLGAGFFFAGYATFQIPANRLLRWFGGVRWISFIAFGWGLCTCAIAFNTGKVDFWVTRFVLGLFEAGFYPGTIVYLRSFYCDEDFGLPYALTLAATCIALCVGGPVITGIESISKSLDPDPAFWEPWRICFLVQGGAAVVCSIVLYLVQPRDITSCSFLTIEEKRLWYFKVNNRRIEERSSGSSGPVISSQSKPETYDANFSELLKIPTMYLYAIGWFLFDLPYWGFIYWTPTIVEDFEEGESNSDFALALISSIPYLGACIGNVGFAYSAQRYKKRLLHQALACVCAFFGLMLASLCSNSSIKVGGLFLAGAGLWGNYGPLWSLIGEAAVASPDRGSYVAFVNAFGNIGGFVGPYIITLFDTKESALIWLGLIGILSVLPSYIVDKMGKNRLDDKKRTGASSNSLA